MKVSGLAMKYAVLLVLGGFAAVVSLRRLFSASADSRPSVGALSDRWLLSQRSGSDEQ